jgi:YHS domain-containing protein
MIRLLCNRSLLPTAIALAVFVVFSLPVPALADERINTSSGLTLAGAPLAIHGYDPVAYFSDGRAVRGRSEHIVAHGGAAYQFANAENKARFEKEPQRYLPQYGGFCAYGVALGAKFDGDPEVFRLVDGKLYLNLNPGIQKKWEEDVTANLRKADQNWVKVRDVAPAKLKP